MAVFTGAPWPGDRLGAEDPMNKCPHCQEANYDEVHIFYTCPSLLTSRHPTIVKTQHLVNIARRDNFSPPCNYLRGLQPRANTTQTIEPYWSAYSIGQGGQPGTLAKPIIVYIDGSGGTHSADPRLRRCGWSWVVNAANGQYSYAHVAYYWEYGSMEGRQTVPRSEPTA
eukprot:10132038-Karenia_brevis.AAC.1